MRFVAKLVKMAKVIFTGDYWDVIGIENPIFT